MALLVAEAQLAEVIAKPVQRVCIDKSSRNAKYKAVEKELRNKGLAYLRREFKDRVQGAVRVSPAKQIPAKQASCVQCHCPLKCFTKFNLEGLVQLCSAFYRSGQSNDRRQFLARFVAIVGGNVNRRYSYSLPSEVSINNQVLPHNIPVCRAFFLGALNTTARIVNYTMTKKLTEFRAGIEPDLRGKKTMKNTLSIQQFESVTQFIDGIERLPSHYKRRTRPNRQYIDAFFSIASLYRTYEAEVATEWERHLENLPIGQALDLPDRSPKSVSYWSFWRIFRRGFPHLSFMRPKTDKCHYCLRYESLPKNRSDRVNQNRLRLYQRHLERKEEARRRMRRDRLLAKYSHGRIAMVQMDMQRNLEVPCCNFRSFFQFVNSS